MKIVSKDGIELKEFNPSAGELVPAIRIKKDAEPLSNKKIVWLDEDYEKVMIFIPFPASTKEEVISEMSSACAEAILKGVEVTLSDGQAHHFSLTLEDQMNLMSLQALVNAGTEAVPYHADGEDCRYYTAEDFNLIAQAATMWKMYQESYFNSLRGYIQSIENEDELETVRYGMEIPEAFRTDVLRKLMGEMRL